MSINNMEFFKESLKTMKPIEKALAVTLMDRLESVGKVDDFFAYCDRVDELIECNGLTEEEAEAVAAQEWEVYNK